MGEIAEMVLDGLLDEETGELIEGTSPGYPRSPSRDARIVRQKQKAPPGEGAIACPLCQKRVRSLTGLGQHVLDKHRSTP